MEQYIETMKGQLWVKDSLEELLKIKNQVLHLTRGAANRADQPKSWDVEEQALFRGIAADERFIYEIMLLCLVIALTRLHDPLKIGGV